MAKKYKTMGRALALSTRPVAGGDAAPVATSLRGGDGLENVVAGLGGFRDKRSHTNYVLPRILTRFDLENMFRGSWLSKRIVKSPVDVMTDKWREFTLSDDDQNPQLDALKKEEKRLSVRTKFKLANYWARLYGGAMIILGMQDTITSVDLLKPLVPEAVKKGDIKYLHVVDRWRCAPSGRLDTDITSSNFGRPLTYTLSESSVEIHWTRILRFDGETLPYFSWMQNGMWDDSVLQHVYESLVNYDTSTAAISSMLFEANIDVVTSEGLTELLSTKDGEAKVAKRFMLSQMMKSYNRTLVLDSKETYDKKQNQFANIDKIWQQFMVDASAAAHIPVSILFGIQSGGLDSGGDDDLQNWYNYVASERAAKIEPQLDYFDQIFVRHVLGSYPDDYASEWVSLGETDDSTEAATSYQKAQRDQIYLTTGVVTEGLVASQLKLDGTYQSMSAEDVKLAEELSEHKDDTEATQRDQSVQQADVNIKNAKKQTQVPPKAGKGAK